MASTPSNPSTNNITTTKQKPPKNPHTCDICHPIQQNLCTKCIHLLLKPHTHMWCLKCGHNWNFSEPGTFVPSGIAANKCRAHASTPVIYITSRDFDLHYDSGEGKHVAAPATAPASTSSNSMYGAAVSFRANEWLWIELKQGDFSRSLYVQILIETCQRWERILREKERRMILRERWWGCYSSEQNTLRQERWQRMRRLEDQRIESEWRDPNIKQILELVGEE